ncbi:hypothetical protein SAMN05216388_101742 [Halorientalis persicus]|uniref:Uncharacterized protein n=1 Tax=Halorientalis persicus TaxID=1367881 RepID=A0A1H8RW07_9EURY|nr:hypothetical protein [Halorientalis persicus]SEO70123.1 hypothetical protein SAMN05216388_101742 [Halorientalis persicus]
MTLYFAFDPPEDLLDDPVEDMGWPEAPVSVYDPTLPNPYDIPGAATKTRQAIEALPDRPHTYHPVKYWVRMEYYPLVENGDVVRPHGVSDDE